MALTCNLDPNWLSSGDAFGGPSLALMVALSSLLAAFTIALIYMIGTALRSPTIGAWARIELYQLATTIFLVAGAAFFINTACSMNLDFFESYYTLASAPGGLQPADGVQIDFGLHADYFEASSAYLISLQARAYAAYEQIRDTLMRWEFNASVSEYKCLYYCLLFQNGWSVDPGIGYYAKIGAGYMALNGVVMGMLILSSMIFILAYAANGAVLWLLPIGAFFRTMPYMRGFGGALMAIALTLFLGYPFLIFINALLAHPFLTSPSITPDLPAGCTSGEDSAACIAPIAVLSATISFATVFLPALNFIILAALARELANMFGGEVDITRLSQML